MNQKTIMVIDDEEQMRKMIGTFLEKDGYETIEASNGAHALSLLDETEPDLLLVDVMMPFMDGFTFAQEVKRTSTIPLIFLSAKGEEWDKVYGLKIGGDDYIVKPFLPGELLARIESVLRRTHSNKDDSDVFIIGPLLIDYSSHQIRVNDTLLSLTRKEFGLLNTLAKNNGRVYSREQLLHLVWEDDQKSSHRTVDTHIKTLRFKLGEYGNLIETVWGVGYKFEL